MEQYKHQKVTRLLWIYGFSVFLLGLLALFSYTRSNMLSIRDNFGLQFLFAGSACLFGTLIGFLFGIPRLVENPINLKGENKVIKLIAQNDNLVQVSDWLTKIIVGVGLIQLYKFPTYIESIGKYYSSIFSAKQEFGSIIAILTLSYFVILGFLGSYLWTRLHLTNLLDYVEGDLNKLSILENDVDEIKSLLDTNQGFVTYKSDREYIRYADDPNKNKFGGKNKVGDLVITGDVRTSTIENRFDVRIRVENTNKGKPLMGKVVFHLHPKYSENKKTVEITNGSAELCLVSIPNPFTIGAEIGDIRLELDLRELDNLPHGFVNR